MPLSDAHTKEAREKNVFDPAAGIDNRKRKMEIIITQVYRCRLSCADIDFISNLENFKKNLNAKQKEREGKVREEGNNLSE